MMVALIGVAYVAGWFPTAAVAMRWCADNLGASCHNKRFTRAFRPGCRTDHGDDCWRTDGTFTLSVASVGSLIALAWPLLFAPALALWIATRKPTPRGLVERAKQQAAEIERLERELNIGRRP